MAARPFDIRKVVIVTFEHGQSPRDYTRDQMKYHVLNAQDGSLAPP
jgi:hypothetical protein